MQVETRTIREIELETLIKLIRKGSPQVLNIGLMNTLQLIQCMHYYYGKHIKKKITIGKYDKLLSMKWHMLAVVFFFF